jgi:predicted metal-dependent phosphoesterase TrpH
MIIDLHIHSKNSDGSLSAKEIVELAKSRNISMMSITDHDSIICQEKASILAKKNGIHYISGVELNVTLINNSYLSQKPIFLDFLGYNFDIENNQLQNKLTKMAQYRQERAVKILRKLNKELKKDQIQELNKEDLLNIQNSANGVFGRPHIADYLVKKRIVKNRKEAFDRYLVKCNVPKYPLYLKDATKLVKNAGGKIILAHPNDPYGTSLIKLTRSLDEQTKIIDDSILQFIDGIECWHSRNNEKTTNHYVNYAKEHGLIMTGGSDCHQKPIVMGTVEVPSYVANQFLT